MSTQESIQRKSFPNAFDELNKTVNQKYDTHELKDVPNKFYCDWIIDKKQRDDLKKHYPKCCFNHWIGLPTLKFQDTESEGQPLNLYEKRMLNQFINHNYNALNKCRGAGASEIKTVRYDLFNYGILNHSKGRKCLTVAGINQDTATIFLHRIKELCDRRPELYLFPPRTDYPNEIFFAQGGIIRALPAVPNAVRSLDNVGDVNYEEAAFWKLVDDKPVLKAGEPHAIKSNAHINNITTPNGKRGYYWEGIFDPECSPPTKYHKNVINWREVVGIPEPDPDVLKDYKDDPNNREQIKKIYLHKYKTDSSYKKWFHGFFGARDINEILEVTAPILDIKKIVEMYHSDRAEYDQELDNQFITTQNKAFGEFIHQDFQPIEFDESDFQ